MTQRIKERTSFQFTWMRVDMTVTAMTQANRQRQMSPDDLNYEVELEISDVNYLI